MDQICSACCSLIPATMLIQLKTCEHSFCVPCLKYAMMDQGSTDLQCPYPVGTFECGMSPNEEEVQYILDFEEEEVSGESNDTAIEELEKSLDRVLTIDADEFPKVAEEELPNVRGIDSLEGSMVVENAVIEENQLQNLGTDQLQGAEFNDVADDSIDPLRYDLNLFPDFGSDLFEGVNDIVLNDNTQKELCQVTPEEFLIPESSDEGIPIEIKEDLDLISHEKESVEVEELSGDDIIIGSNEAEPSLVVESSNPVPGISGESSNPARDVSKGAIPKVPKPTSQESAPGNEVQNPSEDQDLAMALKIQEEESKIDMDLLLAISDANLPPNLDPFECPVCYGQFKPYEGVTLTFCFHSFCKPCLSESVKHSEELEVTCPALVDGNKKCSAIIQDGAIRDLLTEEDFGRFQDRCLQTAEAVIPNTVHCLTPNCRGWVELIGDVESFDCVICDVTNCVSCKAIHGNQSCEDYQANIQRKDDEIKSEATLKTMVETREGMRCPKCGVMITKIEGCDFMTCTTCKTGICWPTRGPRWGPAGQGDISGGCRCKVDNGKRCHPDCEGCH